jgi:thiol-disulfide isomerase/thioredoxin
LNARRLYVLVGAIAAAAGTAMWLGSRPPASPGVAPSEISPAAVFATTFTDTGGAPASLGRFQGKILVVNFWATWCGPCREEMPAFNRLQARWADRGVQFVGLSDEEPERVGRFGRDLGIQYPLWVGGDAVGELSRRLGNRLGMLPFTVLMDRQGNILETKVGPYTEKTLEQRIRVMSAN